MIISKTEQGTDEWLNDRIGKITGTSLKDIMGSPLTYYQVIARFIAEERTGRTKSFRASTEMERGLSEEKFAIERFEEVTGKKVEEVGLCISEENSIIANSPDGLIKIKGKYFEAIEIKSLDSSNQVFYEILNTFPDINKSMSAGKRLETGVPREYEWQVVSYFLVNPDLKILHFLYWDSRVLNESKQLFIVPITKNDYIKNKIIQANLQIDKFKKEYGEIKKVLISSNF